MNEIPILANKDLTARSVFLPQNLLREARRQKGLPATPVPDVCVLDPDGDMVRGLLRSGKASRNLGWACYHTDLYGFVQDGTPLGIIGCAVGGSFAVLLAEELFASGCRLLISMTSAGQIVPIRKPPYHVLIDRALRDEGTSYHYLPPSRFAHLPERLLEPLHHLLADPSLALERGASWTTDAPFRETQQAIAFAEAQGILAVEMEAASLYAFAEARQRPVVCFAHITNQMARIEGDFEKGQADGSVDSLRLVGLVARGWLSKAQDGWKLEAAQDRTAE